MEGSSRQRTLWDTGIHGLLGRLVLPYEGHTRGQLTAASLFGFSFNQCFRIKTYKIYWSQNMVISQESPVSTVGHLFASVPFCQTLGCLQQISSLEFHSVRPSGCSNLIFISKWQQTKQDWTGSEMMSYPPKLSHELGFRTNWTLQIIYYTSLIMLICKCVFWINWIFWQ